MLRLCLVKLGTSFPGTVFDGTYTPTCVLQVLAQGIPGVIGTSCRLFAYWGETPRRVAQLGTTHDAVALIDVPDHSLLIDTYVLPFDVTSEDQILDFVKNGTFDDSTEKVKKDLTDMGFKVSGGKKIASVLKRVLEPVWDGVE